MSKNSNGKYFFYSVVVIVLALFFVWASYRYTLEQIFVGVLFGGTMGFAFWILWELF